MIPVSHHVQKSPPGGLRAYMSKKKKMLRYLTETVDEYLVDFSGRERSLKWDTKRIIKGKIDVVHAKIKKCGSTKNM